MEDDQDNLSEEITAYSEKYILEFGNDIPNTQLVVFGINAVDNAVLIKDKITDEIETYYFGDEISENGKFIGRILDIDSPEGSNLIVEIGIY